MREIVNARGGVGDADLGEQFAGAPPGLRRGHPLVQDERLGKLAADAVERVEGGHRLLENHGDLVAANLFHLPLALAQEVAANEGRRTKGGGRRGGRGTRIRVEKNLRAGGVEAVLLDQAHDGKGGLRLAAAGLADDGQRAPGGQRKTDAVHGAGNPSVAGAEVGL